MKQLGKMHDERRVVVKRVPHERTMQRMPAILAIDNDVPATVREKLAELLARSAAVPVDDPSPRTPHDLAAPLYQSQPEIGVLATQQLLAEPANALKSLRATANLFDRSIGS
jgi:hypothetical protein